MEKPEDFINLIKKSSIIKIEIPLFLGEGNSLKNYVSLATFEFKNEGYGRLLWKEYK